MGPKSAQGREKRGKGQTDLHCFSASSPLLNKDMTVHVWVPLVALRVHVKGFALSKETLFLKTVFLSCVRFESVLLQSGSNAKGHLGLISQVY